MNPGANIVRGILALLILVPPLHAQTGEAPAAKADPLLVATHLSQELEGRPTPGDRMLTLEECLARVFTTNPEIQAEKAKIGDALGEKLVFRSRAFPTINTGILAGQQGPRYDTDAQNFALLSGSFNQPLFEASIPAAFRRADIGVTVAQQNFQVVAVRVLHEARLLYYEALFERSSLAILEELQKPLQDNIKMEKDRFTTGLGTRSAVIQAEIRKLQLVPRTEAARQRYREALASLAQKMGSNLKEPSAVQFWPRGVLPYLPTTFNLISATEEALKNLPDLQLLRSLIRETEEDRRIVRAGYYPQINLVATGQYLPQSILSDSNSTRPGEETRNSEALVGPAYTWQVIDTGKVTGASLALEKAIEAYEIQLTDMEQNVPRNLSEIYRALDLAQKRISALSSSVKLAEDNLKMVQDLISLDQANQLDFVNARNSLLQSKQGMLDAFHQNSIALANLDLATGRYLRYVNFEDRKN